MDVQFENTKSYSARRALMLLVPFLFSIIAIGTPQAAHADAAPTSRYVPLTPARILDTRDGTGTGTVAPVRTDSAISLQVTGRGGVPANASAVVMNVTIANPIGSGYVTVWPHGVSRPVVSSVNYSGPRDVQGNEVTVLLGNDGQVDLYTLVQSDMVADVMGYYEPISTPVSSGRFMPLTPARILDTRNGNGAPVAKLPQGGMITLQVTGRGGVPASGVSAVTLNITATNAAEGYVTVWPAGQPMPTASVLNPTAQRTTVPNKVTVPVSGGGQINLYTLNPTDLIADVSGYYTDSSASPSMDGLFVALTPARVLDTRKVNPFLAPGAQGTATLRFGGLGGVPTTNVAAVLFNLTGTQSQSAGFVTVYPAGQARPEASNLNLIGPGDTKANAVIAPVSSENAGVTMFTMPNVDLVGDVSGYFTGSATAVGPPPTGCGYTATVDNGGQGSQAELVLHNTTTQIDAVLVTGVTAYDSQPWITYDCQYMWYTTFPNGLNTEPLEKLRFIATGQEVAPRAGPGYSYDFVARDNSEAMFYIEGNGLEWRITESAIHSNPLGRTITQTANGFNLYDLTVGRYSNDVCYSITKGTPQKQLECRDITTSVVTTQLASSSSDYQGALSPDGRYLAFLRSSNSGSRVMLLDRSTNTISDPFGSTSQHPTWDAASRLVASVFVNGQLDLFARDIATGAVTQLTNTPALNEYQTVMP